MICALPSHQTQTPRVNRPADHGMVAGFVLFGPIVRTDSNMAMVCVVAVVVRAVDGE